MTLQVPSHLGYSQWTLSSSPLHSAVLHGDKLKATQIINENIFDINTLDHWNRTPLFHAILTSNQEMIEILLKANAKVDISDIHRKNPLHFAAEKGQYGSLKALLHSLDKSYCIKGVEASVFTFHCIDNCGVHPYHLASKLQSSKCLQLLLKYSLGSIDCQDEKKRTPLHWAAAHGSEENVQLLLKNRVDASLEDSEGKLPLHYAALSLGEGSKGCLQALLSALPSNINKKDFNGITTLHLAVLSNQSEKVELILGTKRGLINAGDNKQRTPIHYACVRGDPSVTKCLILAGADMNKRDLYGATPLHYAVFHNHKLVIELLLRQPDFKDLATTEGNTAVHCAASVGANTALILLKTHGGSLTRRNREGKTPLHVASQQMNGSTSTVEVLLQMDAPISARDNYGGVPLHYASLEGISKIVKQLLNADKSCLRLEDDLGRNAIHYSVMGAHLYLTQIFIETGIPVDSPDVYGRNCLHLAAFLGYADVIYLLIQHKTNINARDNETNCAGLCCCLESKASG